MAKCMRYSNGRYCGALIPKGEYSCTEHQLRDHLRATNDHAPASEGFPAFKPDEAWQVANNHKLVECVRRNNLWAQYRTAIDMRLGFAQTWATIFNW